MPPDPVVPVLSRRQTAILVVGLVLSVTATCLVLFGPGRGARKDIGAVRTDLHAARGSVAGTLAVSRRTLDELSAQLRTAKSSLEIQQQGLDVAKGSQRIAGGAARSTASIRRQTAETLSTVRQVIAALGPLGQLRGDLSSVVKGVRAGVELARTTLQVARQALRDGQKALAVAIRTLDTLGRSERIQQQLLAVGRQTLEQVTEINRKLPVPPVLSTPGDAPVVP